MLTPLDPLLRPNVPPDSTLPHTRCDLRPRLSPKGSYARRVSISLIGVRNHADRTTSPVPCGGEVLSSKATANSVITSISAGGHHSLVVNAAGALFAAGRGRHGAIGLGSQHNRRVLALVDVASKHHGAGCTKCAGPCRVVQAAAGGTHSVVLTACGQVRLRNNETDRPLDTTIRCT
eukprot:2110447-Pyramimonas_sp.AAC.2